MILRFYHMLPIHIELRDFSIASKKIKKHRVPESSSLSKPIIPCVYISCIEMARNECLYLFFMLPFEYLGNL